MILRNSLGMLTVSKWKRSSRTKLAAAAARTAKTTTVAILALDDVSSVHTASSQGTETASPNPRRTEKASAHFRANLKIVHL